MSPAAEAHSGTAMLKIDKSTFDDPILPVAVGTGCIQIYQPRYTLHLLKSARGYVGMDGPQRHLKPSTGARLQTPRSKLNNTKTCLLPLDDKTNVEKDTRTERAGGSEGLPDSCEKCPMKPSRITELDVGFFSLFWSNGCVDIENSLKQHSTKEPL